MKAVVIAAGEGIRLRPFTTTQPKVMLPMANKPILEYVIDALRKNGITEIIMVVGYKKEHIMSYFEDGSKFGVNISYTVQERPLGTAYALLQAKKHVKEKSFLLIPGDNIVDDRLISDTLSKDEKFTVTITESEIPSKYGVIHLDRNRVMNVFEKPEVNVGNIISTGIYKFPKNIFSAVEAVVRSGGNGVHNVLQYIISQGEEIIGIKTSGLWMDVIYPWDLIRVNSMAMRDVTASTSGKVEKGVTIIGNVCIGKETIVRTGTYIQGPTIIGNGCEIGPQVHIGPGTSIGNNIEIESFTKIDNSIIMEDSSIGPMSNISNTVIGYGSRVGSHFSTIKGDADIIFRNKYHQVKNIGCMVGEDTHIMNHVVTDPGTIIGAHCKVGALKTISGKIDNGEVVL